MSACQPANKIRVVLGLGANTAFGKIKPYETLKAACVEIAKIIEDLKFSSIYKTSPMYVTDQSDFFNMAVCGFVNVETTAHELLQQTQKIETQFGRDRTKEIRYGPRTLDIDIELFGDKKIDTHELVIPHPRLEERAFVLIPLLEILTDSADNIVREKYAACLKHVAESGVEKFLPPPF